MTIKYVAGFLFSSDRRRVALIEKLRPDWQRGQLNGIGGKIEAGEDLIDAMVREFFEETGVSTSPDDWKPFVKMERYSVYQSTFYRAFSDSIDNVMSQEAEKVGIYEVCNLPPNVIFNLRWLIPLALDWKLDFEEVIRVVEDEAEPPLQLEVSLAK
ncbi:NUDIX domain-containing protein [Rhizobium leguminosarum]|uniref:NUDIX domain-containing protein n=1 Tax=Rhizobium leguminosarum TaxID=384 RepID=UPI0021B104FB|nr:NUDIX domain-containing protein [Rhizobium leguminosarum]MBY2989336.1 NUDIX domain-containing protein [Rhizobium leguminosarum]